MHLRLLQLAIKGLEAPACCGLCWVRLHPLPECRHSPSSAWAALHVQSPNTMGTGALAAGPSLSLSFPGSTMVAYTALNSTHHRCCRMFQRSFCGSWHRTEGHRGVPELFPNPWCPSICSALKVTLSAPQEMPGKTTTDSSKCQILLVLFLVRLQPAKPAWLQHGGHLQAQHLPTHTHTHTWAHTTPANAKTAPFSRKAEPQQSHDTANSVRGEPGFV